MVLREAAFAGQFYDSRREILERQLKGFFSGMGKGKHASSAIIAPHAGYVYSGRTAAYSYACLKKAPTYIIISPNHTGLGEPIGIFPAGEWETPLGTSEIDKGIAGAIAKELGIEEDEISHIGEHSIEVQLPFLQFLFGKEFRFVAITVGEHRPDRLEKLGSAIYNAAEGSKAAVIASSDFTHFEPKESAEKKDMAAIKEIESVSPEGFYSLVSKRRLSICGVNPITALLYYCRKAGIKKGRLLHYDSSATASGDESSVVGYAAIALE